MKKWVKSILLKNIRKNFVDYPSIQNYPFDLKSNNFGYFKSFGVENMDKTFYVIWRDNYGSGFFSNFVFVVSHIVIAKKMGLIPVVDFQNFKTLYNEKLAINNSENAWNYYFESISEFNLEEVYQSKNVFFCDGKYPKNSSFNLTEIKEAIELKNELKTNKFVQEFIANGLDIDQQFLGIQFRGQEQNKATGHSFGPTYNQVLNATKFLLDKYKLNKIFLVTEELEIIEFFEKHFPNQVFYSDNYRLKRQNAYINTDVRSNHRYNLGLEILKDAHLLAKCKGILYSDSNVNEYARYIDNNFEFECEIYNGVNSRNPIIAGYSYNLKKRIPKKLGGLLGELILKENK